MQALPVDVDTLYLAAQAHLDDAAAWWRLGAALAQRAHVREDRVAAIVALRHASSLDTDDETLGCIAGSFVELGEYDAAYHNLSRARFTAASPQHYWRVARFLLESERSPDALALLGRAADLVARDDDLRLLRALALAETGELDFALGEVEALAAQRPDLVAALELRAELLGRQGRAADSIVAWHGVFRAYPSNLRAAAGLAVALAANDLRAEAAEILQKGIAANPYAAELYLHLATVLRDLQRLDEAEVAARRAIELDVDAARGHHELGLVLDAARRSDEAVEAFRDALLRERAVRTYLALARALETAGRADEAQSVLVQALAHATDENRATLDAALDALRMRALSGGGMFAGSLAAFTVWQVLELAHNHRSVGRVELAFPDARVEVFVREGVLVRVRADLPLAPLPALASIVNRQDGTFAFRQHAVDIELDDLNVSIQHALMEIARVQDESQR